MKVKLSELLGATVTRTNSSGITETIGLNKLISENIGISPAKLSYRLSRLAKIIADEQQKFEEERQKLFKKYGEAIKEPKLDKDGNIEKDADGKDIMVETGQVIIKEEFLDEFNEELRDLLEEEVEIWFEPIPIDVFETAKFIDNTTGKEIYFSVADMLALSPFIKDEE